MRNFGCVFLKKAEFGPRIFRETMNVDEVGIMVAGDSKSEFGDKSQH